MFKNKSNTFMCFSPPVMLATFVIEIILLIATLATRKMNKVTKLICATLFALALFQLCEYFVCGGLGVNANMWSRIGFVSITTLPPLGLHLMYAIAGKKSKWVVPAGYGLMAAWIIAFGFTEQAFSSHQCVSNYVIFNLHDYVGYVYSAYYYGLLLAGIWLAMRFGEKAKNPQQKEALYGMIVGYLVFLIPTAVVNTINPATMAGIPSIMCGFAVLFAIILYGYILPRTTVSHKSKD
jgi:hypothetical protein